MLNKVQNEIYFHTFLKARRETMNVTLESVSNKICSASAVQRMEIDEAVPEKLVRNRIIARLGISDEKYEDYLPPKEYKRWELRQNLLKSIERKQFSQAEEQLEEYIQNAPDRSVEKQFIAAMKFMLLQAKNAPLYQKRAIIKEAIEETVEMKSELFPKDVLLSEQEINLFIEYIALYGTGIDENDIIAWRLQEYMEIINYIENSCIDNLGRAKIYPKAVYFWMKLNMDYYRTHELQIPLETIEYGLEICGKAMELLRDTAKLFYFIELLELRRVFCCEKMKYVEYKEAKVLNQLITVILSWQEVLMKVYKEYDISPYMEHFCHLYWEMQSYPIGKVLRTRREMIGMTKEELSDETCDLKSITRCEKERVRPQKYIIRGLFPKVGLGLENVCGHVITEDAEALELYDKITRYANAGDLENWEICLEELEKKLHMEIPENKQVVEMSYNMLLWCKKMISDEELRTNGKNSLENTILLENIANSKKCHLTQQELCCVYRIAMGADEATKEKYLFILKGIFEEYEEKDCVTPYLLEYEFIMTEISSWLGNIGNYKESNKISKNVVKECLLHRRINVVGINYYHLLWNNSQITGNQMIRDKDLLEESKFLCEIAKNKKLVVFLNKKLELLEK